MSSHSEAARTLGDRLRARRQEAQITQMDLANLAGMNVANYGRIERGLGNPNFETLLRLAGVLGVDMAELVAGIGSEQLPAPRARYTAADYVREREARRG